MWSNSGAGEGMNLAHDFLKDSEYCIDAVFKLSTKDNIPANGISKAKMHLTHG